MCSSCLCGRICWEVSDMRCTNLLVCGVLGAILGMETQKGFSFEDGSYNGQSKKEAQCRRDSKAIQEAIIMAGIGALTVSRSLEKRIKALQTIENLAYVENACGGTEVHSSLGALQGVIEYAAESDPHRDVIIREAADDILDIASFYRKRTLFITPYDYVPMVALHALVKAFGFDEEAQGIGRKRASPQTLAYVTGRLRFGMNKEKLDNLRRQIHNAAFLLDRLRIFEEGGRTEFHLGRDFEIYLKEYNEIKESWGPSKFERSFGRWR